MAYPLLTQLLIGRKKSERFDNVVGAPDNQDFCSVRTCSDAPGQYIRPFPVLEPVITAHPTLHFSTARAWMPVQFL